MEDWTKGERKKKWGNKRIGYPSMSTYSSVLLSLLSMCISFFFLYVLFFFYAEVTPLTSHRFHHVSFHPFLSVAATRSD